MPDSIQVIAKNRLASLARIAKDNLDGVRIVAAQPFTAIQFAIENLLNGANGKGNRAQYTFYRQGRLSSWSDR